jgi:opacity protein-like surface antigen
MLCAAVAALAALASNAMAAGKLELYGLAMDPNGTDAKKYSGSGLGGGFEAVVPLPSTYKLLAVGLGLEGVNMMSSTTTLIDQTSGLRVEQRTSQNYGRLFMGLELGSHSSGFLRPYGGLNIAGIWYGISTDVVVPSDVNVENEIRQNLRDENHVAFGWDANAGMDFNFRDRWCIDAGVRFLKAYGVPQQFGAGAVTVSPAYIQYKLGVGFGLLGID